jgi:outer membrane protein assembly factor BamB
VDPSRSGLARTALPAASPGGGLRSAWRVDLRDVVDVAPVVDGRGVTYVVGARGEVIAVAADGTESWRLSTGAVLPGPPVLLADDTLVFADAAGDAMAVRDGALRWRTRFGRTDPARPVPPAPLALDDGGVVVATARELASLDADGHERGRTTLPEAITSPLLAAQNKVVAVTASGAVWTWAPGAVETTRVGAFGGPIDDGAALTDDHTLLAITTGRVHLTAVDLARGTTTTRAVAPVGILLGPPAVRGGSAFLQLQAPGGDLAVGFDATGADTLRALLAAHAPQLSADGGPFVIVAAPHTAPLVDASGTLAFALPDGSVGVLTGGVVDTLAGVCGQARPPAAPTAGLAPLAPGLLVVACRTGVLTALRAATPGSGDRGPAHL